MASGSNTVVKHLPHPSKVKVLSSAPAAGTMRETMAKKYGGQMASGSSTAAEHSPQHSKVEGLSPVAAAGARRWPGLTLA